MAVSLNQSEIAHSLDANGVKQEMVIARAQLTINTLRVGAKQVTKAMWDQIPFLQDGKIESENVSVLGFVRTKDGIQYLLNKNGTPLRMCHTVCQIPAKMLREIESDGFYKKTSLDAYWLSAEAMYSNRLLGVIKGLCRVKQNGHFAIYYRDVYSKQMLEELGGRIKLNEIKNESFESPNINAFYIRVPESDVLKIISARDAAKARLLGEIESAISFLKHFDGVTQLYIAV